MGSPIGSPVLLYGLPFCQFSAFCTLPFSTGQARVRKTDEQTDRQTAAINALIPHPTGAGRNNQKANPEI